MINTWANNDSKQLSASLLRWAAWAPGLCTESEWRQWAQGELMPDDVSKPDVKFLPAMLRRRLSNLSRMALYVAYQCMPEQVPVRLIFASRHGDVRTTYTLLQSIVDGEPVSPTAFSMSVHNTSPAYYSIARQDTSASSALASGVDSLESGFLDAAALLSSNRSDQVMLIFADEPLPVKFRSYCSDPPFAHALALLLSRDEGHKKLCLEIKVDKQAGEKPESHALALLRMLMCNESRLCLSTNRVNWVWSSSE